VCSQCLRCLQSRRSIEEASYVTLSQFKALTVREPKMEVTLCNDLSVVFLIRSLTKNADTTKLIIHVVHACFEVIEQARDEAARSKAIVELFNQLGQVLSHRKELVHLEIHGHSASGNMYSGTLYTGLNDVFKCRSLKTLRISGVPCLLQNKDIPIMCRTLESLTLRDVPFDAKVATDNFRKLVGTNTSLASLTVMASNLSMVKPRTTLEQFPRLFSELVHLDLSNNNLTTQVATDFAKVICNSGKRKLRSLVLCNNMDIGDQGCLEVMAQFWRNNHWLDTLKLEDTGCKDPRTSQSYNEYMDPNKRVHDL
ncbi:hypothetical protein BGX31_001153, partial [Mortierella sp. GBA43]